MGTETVQLPWSALVPFVAPAGAGVLGGGLVAAVTDPLGWEHGSWAAAYLVLVVGVAQLGLGVGQAWLAGGRVTRTRRRIQLAGWNLGSAAVIAGTVLASPPVVYAGGGLLVVALALFGLTAARGLPAGARTGQVVVGHPPEWFRYAYLLLDLVVLVSVPIGLVLSAGRH